MCGLPRAARDTSTTFWPRWRPAASSRKAVTYERSTGMRRPTNGWRSARRQSCCMYELYRNAPASTSPVRAIRSVLGEPPRFTPGYKLLSPTNSAANGEQHDRHATCGSGRKPRDAVHATQTEPQWRHGDNEVAWRPCRREVNANSDAPRDDVAAPAARGFHVAQPENRYTSGKGDTATTAARRTRAIQRC